MTADARGLSVDQIDFFQQNGYLVLHSVVDQAELATIKATFVQLFATQCGRDEGAFYDLVGHDDDAAAAALPQLTDPMNYVPALRKARVFAFANKVARQLMGPDTTFANDHAILKPARFGDSTPWHQDEAYRANPKLQYRELSFWIPLQDATIENGCMHYAAGSHKDKILPHRPFNNDPKVHALECSDAVNLTTSVACPVRAGDLVIHHARTAHYAGANTTAEPRYAYILIFEAPAISVDDEQSFDWELNRVTPAQLRRQQWLENGGARKLMLRKLTRLWHNPRRYINKVFRP